MSERLVSRLLRAVAMMTEMLEIAGNVQPKWNCRRERSLQAVEGWMDDVRGVGMRGGKKAGLKIEIEFMWGF
jgi:hypothetical protein